jgi:hypothetical protein
MSIQTAVNFRRGGLVAGSPYHLWLEAYRQRNPAVVGNFLEVEVFLSSRGYSIDFLNTPISFRCSRIFCNLFGGTSATEEAG